MNIAYQEYLKSDDWKIKKRWMMGNKQCAICLTKVGPLDIHHLNYRNWYDVVKSDLRKLCRDCHFMAHELHKAGRFSFKNDNHNSRFAIIKNAVKGERARRGMKVKQWTPPEPLLTTSIADLLILGH